MIIGHIQALQFRVINTMFLHRNDRFILCTYICNFSETTQTCGGTIQISDEYHLNYTKWESFFFTTESNCLWTLQAPSDTLLSLTFVTVSLKCDAVSYIQVTIFLTRAKCLIGSVICRRHKVSSYRKQWPGPDVIKRFPCSTQLSVKFKLLINDKMVQINLNFCFRSPKPIMYLACNVKMPTSVGTFTFMSMIIFSLSGA